MTATDVLVVSVGGTTGWRAAARELADVARRAPAPRVGDRRAPAPSREVRTFTLDRLRAGARGATGVPRRRSPRTEPRAIIYCSITAALLWPAPGRDLARRDRAPRTAPAVTASGSGRSSGGGSPQAPLRADDGATRCARPLAATHARAGRRPGPGRPRPAGRRRRADRDVAAITYAGDPVKRRLDLVLDAWRARAARRRAAGGRRDRCSAEPPAGGRRVRRAAGARPSTARCCARARVFVARAAPRGLRDRAARGARRRLHARHDAGAGAVSGARHSRARSTRGWSREDLAHARCAPRSTTRSPDYARARRRAARAVQPRCGRPRRCRRRAAAIAARMERRRVTVSAFIPSPSQQRVSHRAAVLPRLRDRVRVRGRRGDPHHAPALGAGRRRSGARLRGRDVGLPGRPDRRADLLPDHDPEPDPRPLVGPVRDLGGRPRDLGRDRRRRRGRRLVPAQRPARAGRHAPRSWTSSRPALLVAQAIGRVGNYFNQELFGKPLDAAVGAEDRRRHTGRPATRSTRRSSRPSSTRSSGTWCWPAFLVWLGQPPEVRRARPVRAVRRRLLGASGSSRRRCGSTTPTTSSGCG